MEGLGCFKDGLSTRDPLLLKPPALPFVRWIMCAGDLDPSAGVYICVDCSERAFLFRCDYSSDTWGDEVSHGLRNVTFVWSTTCGFNPSVYLAADDEDLDEDTPLMDLAAGLYYMLMEPDFNNRVTESPIDVFAYTQQFSAAKAAASTADAPDL